MWDTLLYGHRIPELHAINRDNGIYEIIDGKQRLLTLMKILNNEIPLKRNNASDEIKQYMQNNHITELYFKDMGEIVQYKINNTEINIAEYEGVNDKMLTILFQKLNAGKPLDEFQKHIANNILVRVHYTQLFYTNEYIQSLFSTAERNNNEDEVFLIRLFAALNCKDIDNIDSLVKRDLDEVIIKMNTTTLVNTKNTVLSLLNEFNKLSILPEEVARLPKTWYPLLFKFYKDEVKEEEKQYFKNFLPYINVPAQRGQESTKRMCKERSLNIKKDWINYLNIKESK
jgi:hypothetical protein